MRKITALFTAFCVLFSIIISFSIQAYAENEINIIFTVGDKKLEAVLYDNSTTRELISKMPMTLPMMDLYDREMCYRFSDALPVDDVQNTNYEAGEIIYCRTNA